jgi:phosphoserine phosphatase
MSEIKLVCLDLDETLIHEKSWLMLGLALGMTKERDDELYAEYKAGKITYEEWNNFVVAEYSKHKDATREGITEILSQYTLKDGAREMIRYLRERDYELVLISGSMDIIVNNVAHELGISYARANNILVFNEDGRLESIHTPGDDTKAKADHLEAFCELLDIKMSECACIADGANDIEMFKRTQHGITFTGSPIEKDAWKVIDSFADIPSVL